MTRAEVLVKCHTSHPHALLNIVNHFIVNMARIAAIRRDHNFVIRLRLVLGGFHAALVVGVIDKLLLLLAFMTVGALPLTASLLLHLLRRGLLLLSCLGRSLMLGSSCIGSDKDYVFVLRIGFVGTRFAFLLLVGRSRRGRGLWDLLSSGAAG